MSKTKIVQTKKIKFAANATHQLVVEYPTRFFSRDLDDKINSAVGYSCVGSGASAAFRDMYWLFLTEKDAIAAEKRVLKLKKALKADKCKIAVQASKLKEESPFDYHLLVTLDSKGKIRVTPN